MGGLPLTLTRSLLGVLIPGIVGSAAWLMILAEALPNIHIFYERYPVLGNLTLFAVVVVLGLVIEGLNSYVEARWDQERERTLGVREFWYAYLAQDAAPAPVGHRHISRLVSSLYFELGMMIATPLLMLGLFAVATRTDIALGWKGSAVLGSLALASFFWFRRLARDTHRALCRTRMELVERRGSPNKRKSVTAPADSGRL